MKKITKRLFVGIVTLFVLSCNTNKTIVKTSKIPQSKDLIEVEYPETYELANIILALTKYGKTDKWEVRQNFDYYNKMQEYFKLVDNHPLLDSVNYSRKRWKEYLSFRTDAYAFSFDENNKLIRNNAFYANESVKPFDKHLDLINDFVEKSKFREFYTKHKLHRKNIIENYKKTQYLNEMKDFLISEFGNQISSNIKYKVIISPFVYRMNCHRDIDSITTADFITVPDYIISDTLKISSYKQATAIHNLFTEMDHGYINPITEKYNEIVNKSFDETIWNIKSGYENQNNAVFNEYMTWGVYDIFIQKYFPTYANEIGLYWSFQNDTRGFQYQQIFTQKLKNLYNDKKETKIADLYPKMLKWTSEIQNTLSKPKIIFPKVTIVTKFHNKTKIKITFSEPMETVPKFTIILQDDKRNQEIKEITVDDNNLKWAENGRKLEFNLNISEYYKYAYITFNWWKTKNPLLSKKGVLLKSNSYFKLINE